MPTPLLTSISIGTPLEFREKEEDQDEPKNDSDREPNLPEGDLNHHGTRVGHCQLNGSSP